MRMQFLLGGMGAVGGVCWVELPSGISYEFGRDKDKFSSQRPLKQQGKQRVLTTSTGAAFPWLPTRIPHSQRLSDRMPRSLSTPLTKPLPRQEMAGMLWGRQPAPCGPVSPGFLPGLPPARGDTCDTKSKVCAACSQRENHRIGKRGVCVCALRESLWP